MIEYDIVCAAGSTLFQRVIPIGETSEEQNIQEEIKILEEDSDKEIRAITLPMRTKKNKEQEPLKEMNAKLFIRMQLGIGDRIPHQELASKTRSLSARARRISLAKGIEIYKRKGPRDRSPTNIYSKEVLQEAFDELGMVVCAAGSTLFHRVFVEA